MVTKNSAALARARATNSLSGRLRKSSTLRTLDEADDAIVLEPADLTEARQAFLGEELAAQLDDSQAAIMRAPDAPASAAALPPEALRARHELANTLSTWMGQAESGFTPMRGLLKKKGGAAHGLKVTWHWRFCILHRHGLAIHDGTDRPKGLRSAVPLKHVRRVEPPTADECGGRSAAFALRTDIDGGRSWIFCCMGEVELQAWLAALHNACALTHGSGLANELQQATTVSSSVV